MARLQSKYDLMRAALGVSGSGSGEAGADGLNQPRSISPSGSVTSSSSGTLTSSGSGRPYHRNSFLSQKPRRKRIGRTPLVGQPKLFGGSLEEYLEATNQEIPLVLKSCIRIINLYGETLPSSLSTSSLGGVPYGCMNAEIHVFETFVTLIFST